MMREGTRIGLLAGLAAAGLGTLLLAGGRAQMTGPAGPAPASPMAGGAGGGAGGGFGGQGAPPASGSGSSAPSKGCQGGAGGGFQGGGFIKGFPGSGLPDAFVPSDCMPRPCALHISWVSGDVRVNGEGPGTTMIENIPRATYPTIHEGDVVTTGPRTRVEIRGDGGYLLRIGPESTVKITTAVCDKCLGPRIGISHETTMGKIQTWLVHVLAPKADWEAMRRRCEWEDEQERKFKTVFFKANYCGTSGTAPRDTAFEFFCDPDNDLSVGRLIEGTGFMWNLRGLKRRVVVIPVGYASEVRGVNVPSDPAPSPPVFEWSK